MFLISVCKILDSTANRFISIFILAFDHTFLCVRRIIIHIPRKQQNRNGDYKISLFVEITTKCILNIFLKDMSQIGCYGLMNFHNIKNQTDNIQSVSGI